MNIINEDGVKQMAQGGCTENEEDKKADQSTGRQQGQKPQAEAEPS